MSRPWMKKTILTLVGVFVSFLAIGATVVGYQDWQLRGSSPGNPASGYFRIWADTTGGIFKCLTSAGATCHFEATGTNTTLGILKGDNSTLTVTAGAASCTTATTSQVGCVRPDGTTVTISGSVISAAAAFISSLTTTGTSGAATVSGGVLNIPQYSGGGGSSAIYLGLLTNSPPVLGGFSTINSAPAGWVTIFSSGQYTGAQVGINQTSQDFYKAVPAAPYTVYCAFSPSLDNATTGPSFNFLFYDNSGTPVVQRGMRAIVVSPTIRTDVTGVGAAVPVTGTTPGPSTQANELIMYRMKDDNTNRFWSYSSDYGQTWIQLFTEARTVVPISNYGFRLVSGAGKPAGTMIWALYTTTP